MATVGEYVQILEDNAPDGRYNGKKGEIKEILGPYEDGTELYLVEVDINSGDTGTCVAKKVEPTEHPV